METNHTFSENRRLIGSAGFRALVLGMILGSGVARAQIETAQSGNWNSGATWMGGVVPTSGEVVILNTHTVAVTAVNQILAAVDLTVDGVLDLANRNTSLSVLRGSGMVRQASTGSITLTLGSEASSTFSGTITRTAGTLSLTKVGAGTNTLTGANSYNGATTVNAGELNLSGDNTFAAGVRIINGGTLRLNGANSGTGATTVNEGELSVSGANTFSGATRVEGGLLSLTGSGTIGSGTVTVNAGTLKISDSGTLGSGAVTVNAGTLKVTGSGTLGSGALLLAGGATVDLSERVGVLTLGDTQAVTIRSHDATVALITGSGSGLILGATAHLHLDAYDGATVPLAVSGGGSLTLQSSNTVALTVYGAPLAASDHLLITNGVAGDLPGSRAIQGAGRAAGTTAEWILADGDLVLRIEPYTPTHDPADIVTQSPGGDWYDAATWLGGVIPGPGDRVAITHDVTLPCGTHALESATVSPGAVLTFETWNAVLNAAHVTNNGTMTHPVQNATAPDTLSGEWLPDNRVWIVCSNLTVGTAASITVDKCGYAGGAKGFITGNGPGGGIAQGTSCAGASHGGYGATSDAYTYPKNRLPYGDAAAPDSPGSGGGSSNNGPGGNGGGAVRITASGAVTVDGVISANGGDALSNHTSGGSGGSVFIQCARFAGTNGALRARGGKGVGFGYAGGGGRIAVAYDPVLHPPQITDMTFDTTPGINGTADIGSLWFSDVAMLEAPGSQMFGQIYNLASWTVDSLTITNSRLRFRDEGFRLTVSNDLTISGSAACLELGGTVISNLYRVNFFGTETAPRLEVGGDLTVADGGRFDVYAGLTNGVPDGWGARISVGGTLTIAGGSGVYAKSEPLNGGSPLFEVGGLVVASNGLFSAEGLGFPGGHAGIGFGPGKGSGAGYGGRGGRSPYGMPYGSRERPEYPGSGGIGSNYGHAGNGGGLIRVVTRGLAQIDGTVSADGGLSDGNHNSGGAGGGIFIECAKFRGAPYALLTAKGSKGYSSAKSNDGGGGGGRIAVWSGKPYTEGISPNRLVLSQTPPATFSGLVDVAGGVSSTPGYDGEPGTVVFVEVLPPFGTILLLR